MGKGLVVALAAGLVIAACGGDDDDDDAGDGPSTAATAGEDTATTTGAAASTAPAGSAPGTAGGDCVLDEPLTIGYAADFSDFGGFADVPGSEAPRSRST